MISSIVLSKEKYVMSNEDKIKYQKYHDLKIY